MGSARVKIAYRGDYSNWYTFFIYKPIKMKQTLNIKRSQPQNISEIQIG